MQMKSSKLLYSYWNELRGARSAPDRKDLDPTRIRDALANTFILQADEEGKYVFRLAGSHLCSTYCRELKTRSFSDLWHPKDEDAIETLIRAVTDDHAVALVTFQGTTSSGHEARFETILLPLRHNGSNNARILGGLTGLSDPYWLGTQPIVEQRITGLRLIWPDDPANNLANRNVSEIMEADISWADASGATSGTSAVPTRIFGKTARRYAHLAVIDGGRN
jgi:hypothetical protein